MAEQNKTPNPEVTKPLPTVEAVLADLDKDASEVDLRLLTQEITDITEQEKLDQIRLWATDQHTAAGQNIKELQEQATLIPAIAKSLEVAIKQLQALETQLNEVITATGLRSGELKLREPFQPRDLFDAFAIAQASGDMTAWDLAVTKMTLQIEQRVRENLGAGAPAVTGEADAPQTPTEGEAGKPKKTETTKTEEKDPKEEFADALKTLEEFAEKYPKHYRTETVKARLDMVRLFRNGNWVPAFIKDRWIVRYAKVLKKEMEYQGEVERFKPVTEALSSMNMETPHELMKKAPKKDGKVDIDKMKQKKDGDYRDLTAQLFFMSDIHLIRRPTWTTEEENKDFERYARLAPLRELAREDLALVKEYYSRDFIMDMIKTGFPDLFIEAAADDDAEPVEATSPKSGTDRPSFEQHDKKVNPATAPIDTDVQPEPVPQPKVPENKSEVTTEQLAAEFGVTKDGLKAAREAAIDLAYDYDALVRLVEKVKQYNAIKNDDSDKDAKKKKYEYTSDDTRDVVLPALLSSEPRAKSKLIELSKLLKQGKK